MVKPAGYCRIGRCSGSAGVALIATTGCAWNRGFAQVSEPSMDDVRYRDMRQVRRALIRAYVLHVVWFTIMCVFVARHWSAHGLQASALLTLITVPPVLYYTVRLHTLCRAIDPRARTVGWVPVLITTFVLSPFESGLVLPLKNLLACNRLLRQAATAAGAATERAAASQEEPANVAKPTPLRDATSPQRQEP